MSKKTLMNLKWLKKLRNENNVKKEEIYECKININKTNNENINIIREKIKLEQKIKEVNKSSQNFEINLNLINQKNKFLESKIKEMKIIMKIKKKIKMKKKKMKMKINQIMKKKKTE